MSHVVVWRHVSMEAEENEQRESCGGVGTVRVTAGLNH